MRLRLHAGEILVLAVAGALVVISHRSRAPSLSIVLFLYALAWAGWFRLRSLPSPGVIGAALLHAVALTGWPIWEDDWFRYLWDGWVLAQGHNPYAAAPAMAFFDSTVPVPLQRVLDGINHPDVPTVYGPLAVSLFSLGAWLAPGTLWGWKFVLGCVDVALFCFLAKRLQPAAWRRWAWCPLWWGEGLLNAHVDLAAVALFAVVWWWQQEGRVRIAGLAAAGTLLIKVTAAPLVFLLYAFTRGRGVGYFLLGIVLGYTPFWLQGSAAEWTGLHTMSTFWEFNSLGFALLAALTGPEFARTIASGLIAFGWCWVVCRLKRPEIAALSFWGGFLFVSPVINPWYLLWFLPFLPTIPLLTPWVAMFAVLLSYLTGGNGVGENLSSYGHPLWVRPVEFVFIGSSLLYDWWSARPNDVRRASPASRE